MTNLVRLAGQSGRSRVVALLVLCSLAAYHNSFSNSFHYDDSHSLVDNYHIRSLANTPGFFSDPGMFSAMPGSRMYRPVLLVSYAINYAMGEYDVLGYHVVNFLLHVVNAWLVWELARHFLTPVRRRRPGGGGDWVAVLAALVFCLHPILSEPVNYISSRSSLLATACYLGALLAVVATTRRQRAGWMSHAAVCLLFVLALLSKSIAITLPLVVAAYLIVSGRRHSWSVLVGPSALGLAYALGTRAIIGRALFQPVRGVAEQAATQIKAVAFYLHTVSMPVRLSVEPQFSVAAGLWTVPTACAAALALSLAFAIWRGLLRGPQLELRSALPSPGVGGERPAVRRGGTPGHVPVALELALGACWMAVTLLPSSVVPLNVLVNEHRLYLPMAGGAVVLAVLVDQCRQHAGKIGLACLLLLAALTVQRNQDWQDEETLWGDAVQKGPAMARPYVNLGKAYLGQGRYVEAIETSRKALAIKARLERAHYNIGTAYLHMRRYPEAIASYERALEIRPNLMQALNNMGNAYTEQAEHAKAITYYHRALSVADHPAIHHNLGKVFLETGRFDSAAICFRQALTGDPDKRESHEGLAKTYRSQDRLQSAVQVLENALGRWPEDPSLLLLLGDTQASLGSDDEAAATYRRAGQSLVSARLRLGQEARKRLDWGRARRHYEAALSSSPDDARVHNAMGEVHFAEGRTAQALESYRRAAELDPDLAPAYTNIGLAYLKHGGVLEAIAALERSADLDPERSVTWALLARAYAGNKQPVEAMRGLERAIELAPGHADYHCDLAILYTEAGSAAQAEQAYLAAIKRDPSHTKALYNLGSLWLEQKRYAEAAEVLQRALELDEERPEAYINLANAHLNLGHTRAAIDAYEAYLERSTPQDPLRPKVLGQVRLLRERLED